MSEEKLTEGYSILEETCMLVCEPPYQNLDTLLEDLPNFSGAGFYTQLRRIAEHPAFEPVENEEKIFSAAGDTCDDYQNLINAARKAVEHGYRVFILPNPKRFRTPDFIFERKGVYKLFDLKTISGSNSVDNRLKESVGQTNRVLLHMVSNYEPRPLAKSIKHYFELNPEAIEVLVIKGKKFISIVRKDTLGESYIKYFMVKYTK